MFSHFLQHSSRITPHSLAQYIVSVDITAPQICNVCDVYRTSHGQKYAMVDSVPLMWLNIAMLCGSYSSRKLSTSATSSNLLSRFTATAPLVN